MRTSITHPLNVAYLVVGLVFLGISGSWALRAADLVDADDVSWLLPAVLVAAGVLGLVAMAAKGLSQRRAEDTPPADDPLDDLYGPAGPTAPDLTSSHLTSSELSASELPASDPTDGDLR